jgi:hypothetical protein
MYVYRTKLGIPKVGTERPADTEVDSKEYTDGKGRYNWDKYEKARAKVQVAYWRKHADLHGWFKQLWETNGGKPASEHFGDDFNGGDWVRIDLEDLDALEAAIQGKALPHTTGFFFGSSYGDNDERTEDLAFIGRARQEIAMGYTLFYTSSW